MSRPRFKNSDVLNLGLSHRVRLGEVYRPRFKNLDVINLGLSHRVRLGEVSRPRFKNSARRPKSWSQSSG